MCLRRRGLVGFRRWTDSSNGSLIAVTKLNPGCGVHKTYMGHPRIHKIIIGLLLCLPLYGCAQHTPALARQWQALRIQPGHFDGAAWNDAVDRWQGSKHQVMQQLAHRAGQERWPADQLKAWMGPADQVLREADADHARMLAQVQWQGSPGGELWLYRWRGTHDQLVMALRGGVVAAVGWVYALE